MNGPYVRRMIPEPGDPARTVPVPETFHEQTDDELTEAEIKQMEADDQAIQTILLGLPKDIYAAVDSCETAQEIWLRVQQMMKGSDIGIQEKKAKLFNEWERFTSTDGESIESYYHRFSKLMNDFKRNKHFPEKIANELRAERLAKSQDPLALMANLNNSLKYPVFHPNLPSSSTYIQQPLPNNNNYIPQPSFNHNYMQQHMPNLEDITDPTAAINTALALKAKAFKLNYSTPTNNNQRISSNHRNRKIAQPGMNLVQDNQMQMVGGNGGNQFRQYAGQNVGNQPRIVRDIQSLSIMKADESLAVNKALELEIEHLLRAVVSQDIMSIISVSRLYLTYAPSTITTQRPTEGPSAQALSSSSDSNNIYNISNTSPTPTNSFLINNQSNISKHLHQNVDKAQNTNNNMVPGSASTSNKMLTIILHAMFDENSICKSFCASPSTTKDHPMEQVIREPSRPVLTRNQLSIDGEMCMYALTVSTLEPKNVNEAMIDPAWIESMQKSIFQFTRLYDMVLVPPPENKNLYVEMVISKTFMEEDNRTDHPKSRLVIFVRGYAKSRNRFLRILCFGLLEWKLSEYF
ncbi:hypothetical protein Tco_1314980 [Tanacetum coccineum]